MTNTYPSIIIIFSYSVCTLCETIKRFGSTRHVMKLVCCSSVSRNFQKLMNPVVAVAEHGLVELMSLNFDSTHFFLFPQFAF